MSYPLESGNPGRLLVYANWSEYFPHQLCMCNRMDQGSIQPRDLALLSNRSIIQVKNVDVKRVLHGGGGL